MEESDDKVVILRMKEGGGFLNREPVDVQHLSFL